MSTFRYNEKRFLPIESSLDIDKNNRKRYAIEIEFKGKRDGEEKWLVILKNPSRAGEQDISESDCTVNRVCEYFYQNKLDVSKVIIMNLFPVYETYSSKLIERVGDLVDETNKKKLLNTINSVDDIVLAWGSHPSCCFKLFEEMKLFVKNALVNKNVYQMAHPRWGLSKEKPLHGQVWGYKYELCKVSF